MSGDGHPGDTWTAFEVGVLDGMIAGLALLSFAGL
jgi:hypothetical protein